MIICLIKNKCWGISPLWHFFLKRHPCLLLVIIAKLWCLWTWETHILFLHRQGCSRCCLQVQLLSLQFSIMSLPPFFYLCTHTICNPAIFPDIDCKGIFINTELVKHQYISQWSSMEPEGSSSSSKFHNFCVKKSTCLNHLTLQITHFSKQ